MPSKRFTNEQITSPCGRRKNGATVDEVCQKMGVSEIRRLQHLEDENSRLRGS